MIEQVQNQQIVVLCYGFTCDRMQYKDYCQRINQVDEVGQLLKIGQNLSDNQDEKHSIKFI